MRSLVASVVAASLLGGCQVVNAPVAELDTFKKEAKAGHYQAIADAPVSCQSQQQGCAQVRSIKADACYQLQKQQSALADRRKLLDCAIENYDAALAAQPDPEFNRDQAELGALDALQRRRDASDNAADTDRANRALADHAAAVRRGPNADPAALYYGADAKLNAALRAGTASGCADVMAAAQLIQGAKPDGTAFQQPVARLRQDLTNVRKARSCAG